MSILCIAALGVFSFLVALAESPLMMGSGYDREIFRYEGMVIFNGGAPYVDVFDHKTPLIYLIASWAHPFGFWGFWIAERLSVGAGAVLLYVVLSRRRTILAFWQAIVFLLLLGLPTIYPPGGGASRVFAAGPSMAAFLVLLGTSTHRYLIAGILAGWLLLLQQELVIPVTGCFLAVAFLQRERLARSLLMFAGGIVIGVLPVLVWLAWKGALGAFVEQAFLFNIDYVSVRPGLADRVVRLWRSLNAFSFLSLAVLPLTFAVLAPNKTGLARWRLPLLFTYALAFVVLSISGRFYNHYYLAIVPLVSLLLAFAVSGFTNDSHHAWLSYLKGGLILAAVLFSIPNLPFIGMLRKDASTLVDWPPIAKYEEINKEFDPYLGPISGQSGQFYAWGDAGRLHLNVHYNITSPSKWVFNHVWAAENFDPDGTIFMSIIEDLEKAQTKFVLDYSILKPLSRREIQSKWDSYIRSRYRVEAVMQDGSTLWIRRPAE